MPEGAETASVTVPVKPLVGETVIVDVVDWAVVVEAGVVEAIVMSGVWKVKEAVAGVLSELPVPVMVTVKVPS